MIDIRYVNSQNKSVKLIDTKIQPTSGSLHQRKWNAATENNITTLEVGDCNYTITLSLRGKVDERKSVLNEICDIFDYDCSVGIAGTLYYGNYKIRCFIISSDTAISSVNTRTDIELGIYCPKQAWIKETIYNLTMFDIGKENAREKKYSYHYPFIYSNQKGTIQALNDSLVDCDFLLRIYGACTNPFVKIGKTIYQVHTTLANGEYLEIDSKNRSIFSYSAYGEKRNLFNFRDKTRSDFFVKISSGTNLVSWPGTFKAELILYEQRGEPKWQ